MLGINAGHTVLPNKNTIRIIFIVLIGPLLAGCVTTPTSVPEKYTLTLPTNSRIWDPSGRAEVISKIPESEYAYLYPGSFDKYLDLMISPTVKVSSGTGLRDYIPNTMYFINEIYHNLSVCLRNPKMLPRFAEDLAKAGDAGAFTSVKPWSPVGGYNAMNEPLFNQRNLLLALAYVAQAVFDSPSIPQSTKDSIRAWGDKLAESSEQGGDDYKTASANDRLAQRAATLTAWGAITGNQDLFIKGIKLFWGVMSRVKSKGHTAYIGSWRSQHIPNNLQLRYNNMVLGWLSLTAEIAETNGIPLYKDNNLREAIRTHVKASYDRDFAKSITSCRQLTRYLYNKHSLGSENFAWLEAYLARFPEDPVSEIICKIIDTPVYGGYFGGYTAFVYRNFE